MFVFKKYDRQHHVWSFMTKYLRFLCKWYHQCVNKIYQSIDPLVYLHLQLFKLFSFPIFHRTWWRLFQKRVVCTKFNIKVFISAPDLPANVSIVNVTSSSIEISWTAPENVGGCITNYVIRYMSIVEDNNDTKHCNNSLIRTEQKNTTQNNVTTILLENLQAWTLYQINVSANSSYVEGPAAVMTRWTAESGVSVLFA